MIERVLEVLRSTRFHYGSERELQDGIAQAFDKADIVYAREAILSKRDRPDFLVEKIAIEVKIKAATSALLRQVMRYTEHDLTDIVVVTTPRFAALVPSRMGGKAIHVVGLMGAFA
jgi:hypothetical protein